MLIYKGYWIKHYSGIGWNLICKADGFIVNLELPDLDLMDVIRSIDDIIRWKSKHTKQKKGLGRETYQVLFLCLVQTTIVRPDTWSGRPGIRSDLCGLFCARTYRPSIFLGFQISILRTPSYLLIFCNFRATVFGRIHVRKRTRLDGKLATQVSYIIGTAQAQLRLLQCQVYWQPRLSGYQGWSSLVGTLSYSCRTYSRLSSSCRSCFWSSSQCYGYHVRLSCRQVFSFGREASLRLNLLTEFHPTLYIKGRLCMCSSLKR